MFMSRHIAPGILTAKTIPQQSYIVIPSLSFPYRPILSLIPLPSPPISSPAPSFSSHQYHPFQYPLPSLEESQPSRLVPSSLFTCLSFSLLHSFIHSFSHSFIHSIIRSSHFPKLVSTMNETGLAVSGGEMKGNNVCEYRGMGGKGVRSTSIEEGISREPSERVR